MAEGEYLGEMMMMMMMWLHSQMLYHYFLTQEIAYQEDIQESSTSSWVVQVDLAENYSCVPGWCAVCTLESKAIVHFYSMLVEEVLHTVELSGVKQLKIWSDGPSSQLKKSLHCLLSASHQCCILLSLFMESFRHLTWEGPGRWSWGRIEACHSWYGSQWLLMLFVQAFQLSGGYIRLIKCDQPLQVAYFQMTVVQEHPVSDRIYTPMEYVPWGMYSIIGRKNHDFFYYRIFYLFDLIHFFYLAYRQLYRCLYL